MAEYCESVSQNPELDLQYTLRYIVIHQGQSRIGGKY